MDAFREITKWTTIILTIAGVAAYLYLCWLIIRIPFDLAFALARLTRNVSG